MEKRLLPTLDWAASAAVFIWLDDDDDDEDKDRAAEV